VNPDQLEVIKRVRTAIERAKADGVTIPPEVLEKQVRDMSGGKFGYAEIADRVAHKPVSPFDIGRSVLQGATLSWGDEMGLVDNEAQQAFSEQNPILSGLSYGLGAVAPALLGAGAAAAMAPRAAGSLLGRVGLASATAGVEGAVAGAGEAPAGQRGDAAMFGGMVGAGLGAGADLGLEVARAVRPQVRGARRLSSAIERSGTPDMSKGDFEAGRQRILETARRGEMTGKRRMLADASPPMMLEGEFAASNAVDVFAPLEEKLWGRQLNMSRRVVADLDRELPFGVQNFARELSALKESRQAWASSPAGFSGLRQANPRLDARELARAMQVPEIRHAWEAAKLSKDISEANLPPSVRPAFFAPTTRGAGQGTTLRDIGFVDVHNFRQILDDKIDTAYDAGKGNLGESLKTIRNAVDALLTRQVPGYGEVMQEYAHRMNRERALKSGAKAWKTSADDLGEVVRLLPSEYLEDFRRGMAGAVVQDLRKAKTNRRTAVDLVNRSATEDEKLALVFGDPESFQRFVKAMDDEKEMAKGLSTMVGNSRTALRQGMAETDAVEMAGIAGSVPSNAIPVAVAARMAPKWVNRRTASGMGPLLMAEGPNAIDAAIEEILKRKAGPRGAGTFSTMLGILGATQTQEGR
jgi:hypothetical protein